MRHLIRTLCLSVLCILPVLANAGAEEDALKALDDANAKVLALSAVRSPSVQNIQTAHGEINSLKPFFENVAAALSKVPMASTTRLVELGGSVHAKLDTAGKTSTVDIAVFIDACRGLQGDLDQWQALLPEVRQALQQRVDAKTQDLVRDQVAQTFPTPIRPPAGTVPGASGPGAAPTPYNAQPTVVPTATPLPAGMLPSPTPVPVVDGGVIPGGWTPPTNPPPAYTPIAGMTPQPTPRPALRAPLAIAVGKNNQRVWVANVRGNSVSVMDAGTQRFTAEIAVGSQPQSLALDNGDNTLVVANYASNNVSIIDARKDTVLKTQAVGAGPVQVLVNHAGKAYVLCQEGKVVAVIDLKLKLLLKSIPLSSRPGRMDMPNSTSQIYVTLPDEDSVAIIDTGYDDVSATVKE